MDYLRKISSVVTKKYRPRRSSEDFTNNDISYPQDTRPINCESGLCSFPTPVFNDEPSEEEMASKLVILPDLPIIYKTRMDKNRPSPIDIRTPVRSSSPVPIAPTTHKENFSDASIKPKELTRSRSFENDWFSNGFDYDYCRYSDQMLRRTMSLHDMSSLNMD